MINLLNETAAAWAAWMDVVWLRQLLLLGGGLLLLLALRRYDPRLRRTISVVIVSVLFLPPLLTLEQGAQPFNGAVSAVLQTIPLPETPALVNHVTGVISTPVSPEFAPLNIAFLAWLVVALFVAAMFVRSSYPYYRLALQARATLHEGAGKYARTCVHPEAKGAFVVAWFGGPRIVLPAAWAVWTPEARAAVVAHEMAHIKQKDHLWTLLFALVCVVFWWNPLVWLLFREYRLSAEMCSDDRARAAANIPATAYAQLLLDLACTAAPRLATAVRLANSEAGIKQRILHQVSPSGKVHMRKTILAAVCLALAPYLLQSEAPAPSAKLIDKIEQEEVAKNAALTNDGQSLETSGVMQAAPAPWVDGGFQTLADQIVYPWDQVMAKNEAMIRVEVRVNADGSIASLNFLREQSYIVRGMGDARDLQIFADAVSQAVETARFHPAELEDGSRVQSTVVLSFNFRYRKVGSADDIFSRYMPIVSYAPNDC